MSSKSFKFHGSIVRISTGFAADSPPSAITGITKANPAVVTDAGHGLESGDVIRPSGIVGMTELNGGTYIVEVLSSSTFALVGVDSTDYTAYVSGGTYSVAQYGPNFCELTSYSRAGAAAPSIDATSMCSTYQESERGLPGFGTLEFGYKLAPASAVQATLVALEASGAIAAVYVELPNDGGARVHLGYVTVTGEQGGNGTIWTGTASMQLTGQSYDVEVA